MNVYADQGDVVIDGEKYHPDAAFEAIEDLKIAIGVARGQALDLLHSAGPIAPLSQGGTAVLEAEAAVERAGEPKPVEKPKARKRASSKGKKT